MSFASEVKEELCRLKVDKRCCAQAELYGVLLFCNSFTATEIKIVTGNLSVCKRLPELLKRAFKMSFDGVLEPDTKFGKYSFLVNDPGKIEEIRYCYGYDDMMSLAHHINFPMVEEDHCRVAFLRGAFLAGGSVNDPNKTYHLEMVTTHRSVGRELSALLAEADLAPKAIMRKGNHVTYFKPSETIEVFLTLIGAPISAMEIMNAKVEKQLRGTANRRVNCDAANLDKAVNAAMEQIEAIVQYRGRFGLEHLPDKLRHTAEIRVENPELTLSQLAEICDPPVTKSCLNHRLRKLMELTKQDK